MDPRRFAPTLVPVEGEVFWNVGTSPWASWCRLPAHSEADWARSEFSFPASRLGRRK